MKRTSGGLHKRVARMNLGDSKMDGDGDATKQRHQETALDPVKMDWQIFRGPPDFTHVSLPAIFINNANTFVKMYEAGIRLTSPYQPFYSTTSSDINPDAAGVTTVLSASGVAPFGAQWYGLYASMYRYYSVLSCRYRITAENYGSEPIWMHVMKYNQEPPPANASNEDMYLWKGNTSYYMTPHATWYDNSTNTGGDRSHTVGYDVEDNVIGVGVDTANSRVGVSRRNNAVIIHSDQYQSGDFRREVALDSEVSTWTAVNTNPSYPENLLVRFNTDEASTGLAGDNLNRNRRLQVNVRIEVEYLVEFKELSPEVRYPTRRDPITISYGTTNIQ